LVPKAARGPGRRRPDRPGHLPLARPAEDRRHRRRRPGPRPRRARLSPMTSQRRPAGQLPAELAGSGRLREHRHDHQQDPDLRVPGRGPPRRPLVRLAGRPHHHPAPRRHLDADRTDRRPGPAPRRARPATRHRRHVAVAERPRGIILTRPALTAGRKPGRDNGVMASPLAGLPDELAGHQVQQGAPSPILPNGPGYPRIVQAWLWLKKPTWFLDRCSRAYGDVFTMRLPFGINLVHIGRPELVKAVFGGDSDVLRAGEANATILEPLVGPHSVLVLDGPEHLRQRKLILPAFHGDRMRAWEAAVRDITQAEIARWPVGKPFALRPSMQSITLDVIVQVVFGVETSARRDELRRHILAVTGLGRNPLVLFATRDRRLGPLAPWARFIKARDALHAALVSDIRQRREAPDLGQRSDVLSQLLLAWDDEG